MINTVGDNDVPVAPTWCLTKTHLVFALHPQAVKSRLRRVNEDGFKPFASFAGAPQGKPIAFTAMKMKDILPKIYGFLPWIGQIVSTEMQGDGFEINLFDLPSARALLPYMSDSKSWIVQSPDGIRSHNEGPPLLGNLPTLVPSTVPALFFGLFSVRAAPPMILDAPADAAF